MNDTQQKQLGSTLWAIADKLRGAMNADDFRDYMLSFLFLRYLSDNYEEAVKKELGRDYQSSELEMQVSTLKKENAKIHCCQSILTGSLKHTNTEKKMTKSTPAEFLWRKSRKMDII